MHLASVLAALLLLLGGVSGLLNIFNPLGIVLSVYNIIFALLILVAELKALPVFKTVHKRVDVYFHLLSVPRGKAGFYVFVGVLAFFASQWSISRICILAVAVVGVIQLVAACIYGEPAPHTQAEPQSRLRGCDSAATSSATNPFTSFAMEAVQDAPGMLTAAAAMAATAPGAAQSVSVAIGGTPAARS